MSSSGERYMQSISGAVLDISDPDKPLELRYIEMIAIKVPAEVIRFPTRLRKFYEAERKFWEGSTNDKTT